MRQRPVLLLALSVSALFGLTGCVSVPAEPVGRPGTPSPLPDGERSPRPAGLPPTPTPAADVRGEPARPGPASEPAAGAGAGLPERHGERPGGGTADAGARPGTLRPRLPDQRDPGPRTQRPQPPRPAVPNPPAPRPSYDMESLCDSSTGLTDPSVTGMCRDSYR
ncbi:hypothetical protein [Streptomyces sp. NPDC020141]|uniref:hypothetical protein n=1 Tax=Streptomyces sp. NPDC020141 TaxID=3365065 RepID=UPI0037B25BF3